MVLKIKRGSDVALQVAFTNENATAINLTGYTLVASITQRGAVIVTPALTVTNAAQGLASLAMDETQTALLPLGRLAELAVSYTSSGGFTTIETVDVEGV